MAVERKFIQESVKRLKINETAHKQLERTGCGAIEVKRTPLGTRIKIYARKPGLVIGRKGKNIEDLTITLKETCGVENPEVEVEEVRIPELNPIIMANELKSSLERGFHFRRAAYSTLRRIMDKGARGAQIEISGKLSGTRGRQEKFKEGYIKYCGETAIKYMKTATVHAILKAGTVGVKVKITPPQKRLFDELMINKIEEKPKTEAEKGAAQVRGDVDAKKEEKPKESPKPKEEKTQDLKPKVQSPAPKAQTTEKEVKKPPKKKAEKPKTTSKKPKAKPKAKTPKPKPKKKEPKKK